MFYTLSELTGDYVVYRSLEPADARVPGVSEAWQAMGLKKPGIVRKRDAEYAIAVDWILRRMHELQEPGAEPGELLLLGDTLGNDGGAFERLAAHTGWPGAAFIGSEQADRASEAQWQGDIFVSNRWAGLADWLSQLPGRGLALDERTIAIVDIDKTALGARGRNHKPIDASRLQAMRHTVTAALGADADLDAFAAIYHELNRPRFHDLTGDNQDYLAYVSVMAGAGAVPLADLRADHAAGVLNGFDLFIGRVEAQKAELSPALLSLHQTVYEAVQAGDPTPFKDFRRNEFRATVEAMGHLPDDAPNAARETDEICLTREVWDACRWLQDRGVLITSFSDKPDEACAPTAGLTPPGLRPIHLTPTHLLGQSLHLDSAIEAFQQFGQSFGHDLAQH